MFTNQMAYSDNDSLLDEDEIEDADEQSWGGRDNQLPRRSKWCVDIITTIENTPTALAPRVYEILIQLQPLSRFAGMVYRGVATIADCFMCSCKRNLS